MIKSEIGDGRRAQHAKHAQHAKTPTHKDLGGGRHPLLRFFCAATALASASATASAASAMASTVLMRPSDFVGNYWPAMFRTSNKRWCFVPCAVYWAGEEMTPFPCVTRHHYELAESVAKGPVPRVALGLADAVRLPPGTQGTVQVVLTSTTALQGDGPLTVMVEQQGVLDLCLPHGARHMVLQPWGRVPVIDKNMRCI